MVRHLKSVQKIKLFITEAITTKNNFKIICSDVIIKPYQ